MRILHKFSLDPEQALYVGDMVVDVQAGNNAGIKTVAVTTGSSTREEIAESSPHAIIGNVSEAAVIVDELNDFGELPI